jgi:hypothetical protein
MRADQGKGIRVRQMARLVLLLSLIALGCGGSAAPTPSLTKEKVVNEPSSGTLEDLLAQVEALPAGSKSFELYVPQDLTWKGRPVTQNLAMTLVVDKLLGKSLYPKGFDRKPHGRRYKYTSDPPT